MNGDAHAQSAAAPSARLTMRGIHKRFGATIALGGVDLDVRPGEVHALIGENGAGKSTLMKVLSGAIRADEGDMVLSSKPYAPADPMAARKAGVAMIYQELSLCPELTVEQNINLAVEPTRLGVVRQGQATATTRRALDMLEHAEIDPFAPAGALSVGIQQLIEVARAVAVGCDVLVLDEPTSSLSRQDVERLFHVIEHLRGRGLAIVYISHFLEEVQRIADRFTVLRDGQSVGSGTIGEATTDDLIAMMVGRQVEDLYPRSQRQRGEAVLEVTNLAGKTKPREASLTLHRGEVLGIAGLVGAGRTELLRVIFGLDAITSGQVTLETHVGPASPARRWAQGVGMLSEDRKSEGLALEMSMADNTTLSHMKRLGPLGTVTPAAQARATQVRIDQLDIRCDNPHQPVASLSGGNQQKVALARLLHHDVDILLLDEPTRGIDVGAKATIYQIIDQLARGDADRGIAPKAILMVSSYLPELLGVCDRIAVMSRGKLGEAHDVADCDEHQLMLEATGQGSAV